MADRHRPLGRRLVPLYERLRHPDANLSDQRAASPNSAMQLAHAKYLLLESEKADGTPVATPMWFAAVDDTIYLRTEADSPKVRRIRRHPIVKVAPCTIRGVPTGDYLVCTARILALPQSEAQAEQALRRSYGAARRLYKKLVRNDYVYLELTPVTAARTLARRRGARAAGESRKRDTRPTRSATR
ncbi:MAG TPA: PPOX class F420-dependent oxidoreductase [Solirubrobacteraceae bacterium]|nr:PPOX class F420-dependent oxidoreductase [Solirubrobacteraceae bacterium]